MPTEVVQNSFDAQAFSEFLNSGWLLSLSGSNGSASLNSGSSRFIVGWGAWTESSEPDSSLNACSLFVPDFYLQRSKPWKFTAKWALIDRDVLTTHVLAGVQDNVNANVAVGGTDEGQQFQWVEPDLMGFRKSVEEIRLGFTQRGLRKAVPVVYETANIQISPRRRLFWLSNLLKLPSSLCLYGFWDLNSGQLGATPEILFSGCKAAVVPSGELGGLASEPIIETVALAGTRGKVEGEPGGEILLGDPKERHEHQLVIDDIREVLKRVGQVLVGKTSALELPTLYHLKTPIQVKPSRELDFEALARMLHPTPALGLSPRNLGFDEMKRWDNESIRERFGAPFGVSATLANGSKIRECVVAIRNISWQDDRARIGSGCGFVPASETEREWNELHLKRESVKRMLGL